MRVRFHNIIAACFLIISIGGHWALLQSVAWMGMLVTYSQSDTLSVAVEKTFDGKHPCGLCKAVDQGKSAEGKKTLVKSDLKINWMLVAQSTFVWFPSSLESSAPQDDSSFLVFASPPIPPPKTA